MSTKKRMPRSRRGGVSVSLEMGSGAIKEGFVSKLAQQEVNIRSDTEVVLVTPDMGKRGEKDEYFVPNLHNGLFRIHAFLYDKRVHSSMLCSDISDMNRALTLIGKHKPPFVAFSPYYDTMQHDLDNISTTRRISPDSVIVAGGIEVSLNPQWQTFGGLVDILVRGEGELPLLELVQRQRMFKGEGKEWRKPEFLDFLRADITQQEIQGVSVVDGNGLYQSTPIRERMDPETYQDINLIAFEKHLDISPIEQYWKLSREMFGGKKDTFFRFMSSSHCPLKCIFCQSSVYYTTLLGKRQIPILYVTPNNVMRIINAVGRQYPFINSVYIDDDDFFLDHRRAEQVLDMMIQARKEGTLKGLTFHCKTRTDNIDEERARLLKEAGFATVSLGSESYSAEELAYMRKRSSSEKNMMAIKILREAGLHIAENYILYVPPTTTDTFHENASKICHNIGELDIDGGATLFLTPLPGTDLWGDGKFETVRDFPYRRELFHDKVMFRNHGRGYDYIGEEVIVPGRDTPLPHPQILLPNDPAIRSTSLDSLLYLPETVRGFRKMAGEVNLSRSLVTLANLSSAFKALYRLTGEQRWGRIDKEVDRIVMSYRRN